MARSPYKWPADGKPAIIKQHSVAKHDVLRTYLVDYIQTLVVSPQQDQLRLTFVDGFAGGGIYLHDGTRETIYGSPFAFLQAAEEAANLLNAARQKPLAMNVDYFFVELDGNAFNSLKRTLVDQGYGPRIGVDIHLFNSSFETQVNPILAFIAKKSPRSGRSIFLLDQYGYADVPTAQIRGIFSELPAAEVLLTFNVDSFLNYASDGPSTRKTLTDIGIPDVLRGRTIEDIKRSEKDWRLYIQSCLYRELVEACGARYYTLFFIRTEGHGDYWLVHLSQHPRARDVMARVHWSKNNNFIHYGGSGIDMFRVLGYSADRDLDFSGQGAFGFCFDDIAGESSVRSLMSQLPSLIYARDDGVSFGELFATTCNLSPADSSRYKEALERLVQHKEISIVAPDGARRLKASTITDKDQLLPTQQKTFGFG
jgi:three-Cys-motif partner protein